MKFPWQKSHPTDDPAPDVEEHTTDAAGDSGEHAHEEAAEHHRKGYTPPKGRPTPKRKDVEIQKGVRRSTQAPLTRKQSKEQRKKLKESMSKEEWKEYRRKERDEARSARLEAQRRMDAGDERYLLDRDKGEERRYVRDWIDARRFLNNLVMPFALVLLVILLISQWQPVFANIASLVCLVVIIVLAIEAVITGRRVNNAVRAKFPGSTAPGFSLGFYAYSRMTQPRKWRTPRPRVEIGAEV
ncbi:DUF3043 domain-containing protein [Corynebacterium uropygiale]|uniref:DUF3043 domain-containing protein n=1 Tax=Corynebacterium uropygiale TaxID=1775911 RepID=A0A9X1QMV3_9CORY|nr:DUF3043 domain-containing protein [Corynebacterium uropygiale]